jgi:hypothetical protein
VLGCRVRPLERVGVLGCDVFGLGSRATAYRLAERDAWPMAGSGASRYVIVPALLDRLGIPYEVETGEGDKS